jgi:hypothetical protein
MGLENKPTQCDKIIKFIKDFGYITSWQAYQELGVTQLGARIYQLKERGYKFTTTRVTTKNRYGEPTHFDEYRLVDDSEVAS